MESFRFVAILLVLFVFTKSTADEFNIPEDFESRGAKDGKPIPIDVVPLPPMGKRGRISDRHVIPQDFQKWILKRLQRKQVSPAAPTDVYIGR